MPLTNAASLRLCRLAALAALLAAATLAQAQVARVIETRGAAMVERAGQAPRLLGIGEGLDRRDTIRVARDSWAVLEFTDQTRITLRPDTVFRIDAYSDNAPESVLMGLVKGGFRAVTGLIGKRNPRAVVFGTPYATIGIRGTEFDARLCDGDCAAADTRPAPPAGPAARVANARGPVSARDLWGRTRTLASGSIVDAAEEVRTGARGSAVLELRDGGRILIHPQTRFEIRRFVYDPARPAAAIAEFELRAGSIRAATGAIGKARPVGYRIFTKLGQIGTRGTELVANCTANCESTPPKPPPPPPPPLGNVGEIRLPNGIVLETRLVGGETRLIQRPPSQGEPIGTLPDGTPLYANPATAIQQDTVEWVFQDGYLAPRSGFGEGSRSPEGVRVSMVVVRDGALQVLSEPPYLANQTPRDNGITTIQTVNPDGTISRSDANAAYEAANLTNLDQPITLADGSQVRVFDLQGAGADMPGLNQFISTLLTERAETLTAQNPPPGLTVATVEGTVSVETQTQSADVPAGQTGSVSPDGNVTTSSTTGTLPGPTLPPAEPPAPTTPPADSTEPGLYTWVRDGAITLEKDGTMIEVTAGSAALAGQTVLRLLASVPNFLRLDPTPLPDPDSLRRVSIFTAPDGTTFGSCRVQ